VVRELEVKKYRICVKNYPEILNVPSAPKLADFDVTSR